MGILKKLFFAPFFLLFFFLFASQLNLFIQDPYFLLNTSSEALVQSLLFLSFLLFSSLFFVIFTVLSSDFRIVLPVIFIASALALPFTFFPQNLLLVGGFFLAFCLIYLLVARKLASYLLFQPTTLFIPLMKQVAVLSILVVAVNLYLVAENEVKENGLQLPKSLLEASASFGLNQGLSQNEPFIPPQQLELLKQDPQALKQYGLDPSVLETLSSGNQPATAQNTMMALVEKQITSFLKPYLPLIPAFLAGLFFLTFYSAVSFFSFILLFFTWFIFWILEKTGFIKFEVETREVKKLVV